MTLLEKLLSEAEEERKKGHPFLVLFYEDGYSFDTTDSEGLPLRHLEDGEPDWDYPQIWVKRDTFFAALNDGLSELKKELKNGD